jgi:hypothetical protein
MYEQLVARPKVMPYFEHLLSESRIITDDADDADFKGLLI